MFSNKQKNYVCFLCMCNKPRENLFHAVALMSEASKQTLLYVIENIVTKSGNQINKLPADILLCIECSRRIINFDTQWCLLVESVKKSINCLYGELEVEEEKDEIVVGKEFQILERPKTDYDLMQKLKRKNANNLFACLDKEKEIQQDVAIKEEDCIDDPLTADELKEDTLKEEELHTLLFKEPTESENTEETKNTALLCQIEFKNKKEVDEHIDETHKRQLKFKCSDCSFEHQNENHLIIHRNSHRGLLDTQCPWCEKKYATKRGAIRHMEQHMGKQNYQCDKCGLGFTKYILFENHKMIHDAEENPLICEICKKRFKTIKTFRYHCRTHREDRPRYTCQQCGKVFVDKYAHTKHMRLHFNLHTTTTTTKTATTTTQIFNCIICNETFTEKPKLDEHMVDNHDVVIQSTSLSNKLVNL